MTVTTNLNSVHLDATGQAHTGPGKVVRAIVNAASDAGCLCNLYDATSAINKITPTLTADVIGTEAAHTYSFELGIEFATGLYVTLAGAGGEVTLVLERY